MCFSVSDILYRLFLTFLRCLIVKHYIFVRRLVYNEKSNLYIPATDLNGM